MTDHRWSKYIQTTEELYVSRQMRFTEKNKDIWLGALRVRPNDNVLEVGCAGGAFCHRLSEFVPGISVTGVDLDAGHIDFAKKKTEELGRNCRFFCGDACDLPFDNNIFDVCYSHTVAEHVPHEEFYREQYRVLKPGGKIVVMSVRAKLRIHSNFKASEEESYLLQKMWERTGENPYDENVGIYEMEEHEYPRELEKYGFHNVDVTVFTVMDYVPDNAGVSSEMAIEQINMQRTLALSPVKKALNINEDALNKEEQNRLLALINKRFDERIEQYRQGVRLWDFSTSAVLAVSGIK